MPRAAHRALGSHVYHVINRGGGRMTLFDDQGDYATFGRVLADTQHRFPMRLLADGLMPNHWHPVVWPVEDGQLGRFVQRLTIARVRRSVVRGRPLGRDAWAQRVVALLGLASSSRSRGRPRTMNRRE